MSKLTVENVYTRQSAKELTKRHFWKLLGMMLILAVITYGLAFGGMFLLSTATGATWQTTTTTTSVSATLDPSSVTPAFLAGYAVLMLVITLVSSGLGAGLTSAAIELCRDREHVGVGRVFCRMKYCLKFFGLAFLVMLKIVLWMLPAFVVTGVGYYFVLQTQNETLTMLLPLVMLLLVFGLVIPAVYRYMLSSYILADEPSTGVFACVKQSKALMKGHKWQAFKLVVPFILMIYVWMFAIIIVMALATVVLSKVAAEITVVLSIAAMLLLMVVVLVYALRLAMANCIFYLKRKGDKSPIPEEEEERIVCWQPITGEGDNAQ